MNRGLDAPKSDAEYLRIHEAQQAKARMHNGIRLGPDSPLLPDTAPAPGRAKKAKSSTKREEHLIQVAVFERVNDPAEIVKRPALALVHAVPNGSHRTPGVAAKLKAEGVKAGVLDIDCPVARGGYFGLRIEVKKPRGTISPEQADWMAGFAREGMKVALHTSADAVWAELINYLDLPRTTVSPTP